MELLEISNWALVLACTFHFLHQIFSRWWRDVPAYQSALKGLLDDQGPDYVNFILSRELGKSLTHLQDIPNDDDESSEAPSAEEDSAEEDSAEEDSAEEDSAEEDSAEEDSAEEDSAEEDTGDEGTGEKADESDDAQVPDLVSEGGAPETTEANE